MLAAANGPSNAFAGNDLTAFAHPLVGLKSAAQHSRRQTAQRFIVTKYTVPDVPLRFAEMAGRLRQIKRQDVIALSSSLVRRQPMPLLTFDHAEP